MTLGLWATRPTWWSVFTSALIPKALGKRRAAVKLHHRFLPISWLERLKERKFTVPPAADVPAEYIDPVTGTIDVTQMTNDGRQISGESEDRLDPQLKQQELQANDALADDNQDDADDNGNIGAIY